jgi:hypothetical protein
VQKLGCRENLQRTSGNGQDMGIFMMASLAPKPSSRYSLEATCPYGHCRLPCPNFHLITQKRRSFFPPKVIDSSPTRLESIYPPLRLNKLHGAHLAHGAVAAMRRLAYPPLALMDPRSSPPPINDQSESLVVKLRLCWPVETLCQYFISLLEPWEEPYRYSFGYLISVRALMDSL